MQDTKEIVIEMRIRKTVKVPESWDKEEIEFFFNDSTHCISNELADLMDAEDLNCLCGKVITKLVEEKE